MKVGVVGVQLSTVLILLRIYYRYTALNHKQLVVSNYEVLVPRGGPHHAYTHHPTFRKKEAMGLQLELAILLRASIHEHMPTIGV
jgi:hypothetical protein